MNYYWSLKNPDPLMPVWAKRRMESCIKKFRAYIEQAAKGTYESTSTQSTLDWSDQRLDFRINMTEQGIKILMADRDEYYKERDRRRSSDNGLPDR